MTPIKVLFVLLVVAAGGYGIYSLTESEAVEAAPPVVEEVADQPAPKAPEVKLRTARATFAVDPEVVPEEDRLKLPNGEWVMALNGVKNAPKMHWPSSHDYSEIVSIETAKNGQQWYVHASGAKSTTQMAWRSDVQRMDAVTNVAIPTEAAPVHNSNAPTRPDPMVRR